MCYRSNEAILCMPPRVEPLAMFANLDFLGWGAASISAIGLSAALFAFILGRLIIGRGGKSHPVPLSWSANSGTSGVRRRPASAAFLERTARARRGHVRRG